MSNRRMTLLDGREIDLSSDDSDLTNPWTCFVQYEVDGQLFEFAAGALGFGRVEAEAWECEFTQHVSMPPGALHVGGTSVTNRMLVGGEDVRPEDTELAPEDAFVEVTEKVVIGCWEGREYSVHAVIFGGETEPGVVATEATASDLANVVWLFDQFVFTEHPTGVRMHARGRNAKRITSASALVEVPNVGVLDIREATPGALRDMPRFAGTRVRGGELFSDFDEEGDCHGGGHRFLLLNDRVITWVLMGDDVPSGSIGRLASLSAVETKSSA